MAHKPIITITLAILLNLFFSNALASCINKNDSDETNYSRCFKQAVEFSDSGIITKENSQPEKYISRSAKEGNSTAQYYYALLHKRGTPVGGIVKETGMRYLPSPPNDYNAKKWFKKSAQQGDARAQYELGMLYLTGNSQHDKSMPRNVFMGTEKGTFSEKAEELFKKSVAQGYEPAKVALAEARKIVVAVREKPKTESRNRRNTEEKKRIADAALAKESSLYWYQGIKCWNDTKRRNGATYSEYARVLYGEGGGEYRSGDPVVDRIAMNIKLTDATDTVLTYTPVDKHDQKKIRSIEVRRDGTAVTIKQEVWKEYTLRCENYDKKTTYKLGGIKTAAEKKQLAKAAAEKKRLAKIEAANVAERTKDICYSETSEAKEKYTSCLSAARNGDPLAKVSVASLYTQGPGVKIDYAKAIYWYKEAIKDGGAYADHATSGLYLVDLMLETQKKAAKAEERARLADTWFEIKTDWNSSSGKFEVQCKAGESPAEYAKTAGAFGGKVNFKDEVSKNGKVVEVTVVSYNIVLKQNLGTVFYRGLDRCEAGIAAKNSQREANKRALDKYR